MDYIGILQLILLIFAITVNSILVIAVYRSNRSSATNKLYAFLGVVMSSWLLTNYLSVNPSFVGTSLWWIRLSIFFATPMSVLFLLLAVTVPKDRLPLKKTTLTAMVLVTAAIMALDLSPYAFTGLTVQNGSATPTAGPGLLPFALLSTLASIFAVYILLRKLRRTVGEENGQIRFIMYGIVLMLGLVITTIFIPVVLFKVNVFVPFIPLYTLLFLGLTAYAIVKHHLFNLKVIATQALTLLLWIMLFGNAIISTTTEERFIGFLMFGGAVVLGVFLIRSVQREVKQREQLQVLSEQLKEANEKLQVLDKARAEFISIASHQLRTPPSTIKWYIGAIMDGDFGPLTPDLKAALERVQTSNNGQISLIDDLLNASRIERGKLEFFFEMGDVEQLAKSAYEQLVPQAAMHKLELVYEPPQVKLPQVMLDKEKIRQVVNNFIDNAIKYTKQGQITIHYGLTPTDVVVMVTDTGRGVPPDVAPTLFEKYTRGKDSATAASGLGLGLYVAKVVVEQNKGKIWAESPGPGQGSTFAFSLPIHNTLQPTSTVDLTASQGSTEQHK